jgi:hypothetical protein
LAYYDAVLDLGRAKLQGGTIHFRFSAAYSTMSKAMQSIVDTYVALNRPEALQELQAHRLKLIGSERSGFDLFRQQIEDELAIIREGLVRLTTPVVTPQPKPDEPKSEPAGVFAPQQVAVEPELPLAIVPPSNLSEPLPVPAVAARAAPEKPKPAAYGFPTSGIAMPILAAAVFSKDAPTDDPAGHAIRLQVELTKRSIT